MIVEDEDGWSWAIHNGDPAADLVTGMVHRGFRRIVLPRRTITDGVPYPGPSTDDLDRDATAYRTLKGVLDGDTIKLLGETFLRRMALYDASIDIGRVR